MATAKKKPAKADAPYGLKTDGTPKKKPGVKTGSVRKAPAKGKRFMSVRTLRDPATDFVAEITDGRINVYSGSQQPVVDRAIVPPVGDVWRMGADKRISEIDDQMGRLGAVVVDIERTASDLAQALSAIVHPTVAGSTDASEEAPAGSGLGCSIMEFRSRLQRAVATIRATIDSLAL